MSALGAAATGSADAVKKNKEEVAAAPDAPAAAGAPWVDEVPVEDEVPVVVEESATGGNVSGHV